LKNQLIQYIKSKLKITGGHFVDAEISDYIANIPPAKYKELEEPKTCEGCKHLLDCDAITCTRWVHVDYYEPYEPKEPK
jgi:hypothetical protein